MPGCFPKRIFCGSTLSFFVYNMGSRRVLEKAGFQLEGILRSNACKNGQVLDMAMYGLTRERGDEIL